MHLLKAEETTPPRRFSLSSVVGTKCPTSKVLRRAVLWHRLQRMRWGSVPAGNAGSCRCRGVEASLPLGQPDLSHQVHFSVSVKDIQFESQFAGVWDMVVTVAA